MADPRQILQGILEGEGLSLFGPKGGSKALNEAGTSALRRRAQENLDRLQRERSSRIDARTGDPRLRSRLQLASNDARLKLGLEDSGELFKEQNIQQRLQELTPAQQGGGGQLVAGSLEGLGIRPQDIEQGLGALQNPSVRERLMELLQGKRGGFNPSILLDRVRPSTGFE